MNVLSVKGVTCFCHNWITCISCLNNWLNSFEKKTRTETQNKTKLCKVIRPFIINTRVLYEDLNTAIEQ